MAKGKNNKKGGKNSGTKESAGNEEKVTKTSPPQETKVTAEPTEKKIDEKVSQPKEVEVVCEQSSVESSPQKEKEESSQSQSAKEEVPLATTGNIASTANIPQAPIESPCFQYDIVYPTQSHEEIDHDNDAADQLPPSSLHRNLVPVDDNGNEDEPCTGNDVNESTAVDNAVENETVLSSTEDANLSMKENYSTTATAGNTVIDTEEDINMLDNTVLPTIDQVYPQVSSENTLFFSWNSLIFFIFLLCCTLIHRRFSSRKPKQFVSSMKPNILLPGGSLKMLR